MPDLFLGNHRLSLPRELDSRGHLLVRRNRLFNLLREGGATYQQPPGWPSTTKPTLPNSTQQDDSDD